MIVLDFGKKIKGDSQISKHEDWITVDSVQAGVGRSINFSGSGKDRDTSTPNFSEVTITKSTDITSTELFGQATYGKAICPKAVIHWVQTSGEDSGQVYCELELTDPIISSYSLSSGGERPSESISISFTKIVMKYTQFDGNKTKPATPKGYDLTTGKAFAG